MVLGDSAWEVFTRISSSGAYTFPTIINDLPDDAIRNIAIYADKTTLYFKCDQALGPSLNITAKKNFS